MRPAGATPWRRIAIGAGTLIPFGGLLGYLALTTGGAPREAAMPPAVAPEGHAATDIAALIDGLRAKLARQPHDATGWALLGRTLAHQQLWDAAGEAFRRAVAEQPDDADLHMQLGETLVLARQGQVTQAALAEFAHAADDPRARYYRAVAAAQAGDPGAARAQLQALIADAPADAPWLTLVRAELGALPPGPEPAAPQP